MTQNLGRYLGVPILHERVTNDTYQCVLDKMDQKLTGWKASSLSLAGRVTLAQSVLSAIPSYIMQTSVLPSHICSEIDKKIRNFVWGTTEETRKAHLISWEAICTPKSRGGLGLRSARQLNQAYMMKLGFLFLSKPDELWVQVLQAKYFKDEEAEFRVKFTSSKSAIWRGILAVWPKMTEGVRSGLRNGRGTLFWTSRWIDSGERLIDFILPGAPDPDFEASAADFCTPSGKWNFPLLRTLLPEDLVLQIAGLSPPEAHRGDDATAWGLEKDGRFRIRSAYDLLGEQEGRRRDVDWELVWRWKGPNRIKHFLWLVAHDRLLTNEERRKRTWTDDGSCSRCGHPQETVLHVLRDCSAAVNTWTHLAFLSDDRTSWDLPLLPWITHHLKEPSSCLLFGVACWSLWKTRNEAIFTDIRTTPEALSYRIRHWTSTVGETLVLDQFITPGPPAKTVVDVSWMPPPPEWVTLNSDGSVIPETG
ncbi:Putative ribonuclease H protein At1g65750 [Linum perenne]